MDKNIERFCSKKYALLYRFCASNRLLEANGETGDKIDDLDTAKLSPAP